MKVIIFVFVPAQDQKKICSMMLPALPSVIGPSSQIIPCRSVMQTCTKKNVLSRKTLPKTWLTLSWHLKSVRYREEVLNSVTNIIFLILSLFHFSKKVFFFYHLHALFLCVLFGHLVFHSVVSPVWGSGGPSAPLGHRGSGHWTETTHLWHDI